MEQYQHQKTTLHYADGVLSLNGKRLVDSDELLSYDLRGNHDEGTTVTLHVGSWMDQSGVERAGAALKAAGFRVEITMHNPQPLDHHLLYV